MPPLDITQQFDFTGRTAVITGGAGILGSDMARALAARHARVVILDRDLPLAEKLSTQLHAGGATTMAIGSDVLDKESLTAASTKIIATYGKIDILINAAGGNNPKATTGPDKPFFDIPAESLKFVTELNQLGTILPCQVFGRHMAERKEGIILNISSMTAFRPLTRVVAYSAAKAAISNFTQWLAVHMAMEYAPAIRVNAIAPGFFLTDQNRFLLTDKETGALTARGKSIIAHTPMQRFGEPDDLIGAVLWLLSPASQFVTGVVLPIDGGFAAFSGV